jgi:anti-sigma B factor antagonist
MNDQTPRIRLVNEGEVSVVELLDKKILDEESISVISEQLFELAAKADKPRIVLDFINVGHMSSSALGMLITLHKRVREKGGHLRLCCIRPSIYEVFEITRLNQVFQVCAGRKEAVDEAASA